MATVSVGRIVHYNNGECVPAIVTRVTTAPAGKVHGSLVDLVYFRTTLGPRGLVDGAMSINEGSEVGTWHWPEQVE